MKTLAIILMLWCAAAHAACKTPSDPVPAPAAAKGFTCEVFWDDFTTMATVDVNNTSGPAWSFSNPAGYKWYVEGGYGSITPPSIFSIVAGGLQFSAPDNSGPAGIGLYQFASCRSKAGGGYIGTSVQGGMYIDIKLSTWGPQLGGNLAWPAAWTLGIYQLYGGQSPLANSPELDLREWAGTEPRYVHYWQAGGTDTGGGSYVSSTPTFVSGYTYGAVLLNPGQNGGTTGTLIGYLNDVIETNSTPITWAPGGLYSNLTETPMCILFHTGYNQPTVVRSVQVWQAPTGFPGSARLFR